MDTMGRLCELLDERGMSLFALAQLSGVSPSTLRNTKRRAGQLKIDTIERICQALGITLSQFFDQNGKKC